MNHFEFAEEFKLSLAKAKAIKKRFPQLFVEEDSRLAPIRYVLARNNRLTAFQLVGLIENPKLFIELGKYADAAKAELARIGEPMGQAAPKLVAANIMEAAKNEREAVQILVDWMRSILPSNPVGHAWVAVRLILGLPESLRASEAKRIPRALLNARKHIGLAGWWHVTDKQTFYKRGFDL